MAIVQAPSYVLWLNEFYNVFRTIWTDGRELPKETVPRYYGYSVGHWEDDYTFVVETIGLNDKTWLDNAGRPHSDQLRVVERFHRPSREILESTVTIDDPSSYMKTWGGRRQVDFSPAAGRFRYARDPLRARGDGRIQERGRRTCY